MKKFRYYIGKETKGVTNVPPNNNIPKYIPIGDFYTPILKEVVHENDKIELTISGILTMYIMREIF